MHIQMCERVRASVSKNNGATTMKEIMAEHSNHIRTHCEHWRLHPSFNHTMKWDYHFNTHTQMKWGRYNIIKCGKRKDDEDDNDD